MGCSRARGGRPPVTATNRQRELTDFRRSPTPWMSHAQPGSNTTRVGLDCTRSDLALTTSCGCWRDLLSRTRASRITPTRRSSSRCRRAAREKGPPCGHTSARSPQEHAGQGGLGAGSSGVIDRQARRQHDQAGVLNARHCRGSARARAGDGVVQERVGVEHDLAETLSPVPTFISRPRRVVGRRRLFSRRCARPAALWASPAWSRCCRTTRRRSRRRRTDARP
jgi:hypothetical protein